LSVQRNEHGWDDSIKMDVNLTLMAIVCEYDREYLISINTRNFFVTVSY
jgi:hypothetical protein